MEQGKTKLVLNQQEVCKLLNISRPTYYKLIQEKKLQHIRLGRKIFVTKAQLERLINSEFPPDTK